MGKKTTPEQKREEALLNNAFEDAASRGNYLFIDYMIKDAAYGSGHVPPKPAQAFVLLKAKARLFDEGDIRFDNALCAIARLIADESVNAGNNALLMSVQSEDHGEDILRRIADGNFRVMDKDGRNFSKGFDEFHPKDEACIIRYARAAIKEIERLHPDVQDAPEPDHLSR